MNNTPPFKLKPMETVWRQTLDPLSVTLNPDKERVLNFQADLIDADTIRKIAKRAADIASHFGIGSQEFAIAMDVTCVHLNIRKLKLLQLLMAGDDDFTHDVYGINRYLNRREGVLTESFVCKFFDYS